MAKKQEVVERDDNLGFMTEDLTEEMRGGRRGTETLGVNDLEMPRFFILQGTHDEVVDDGHNAGEFYHNIAEEALGKSVLVVPILIRVEYTLWKPRLKGETQTSGGQNILCRATDGITWDVAGDWDVKVTPGPDGKIVKWSTRKSNDPDSPDFNVAATVLESGLGEFGSMDPDNPDSHPAAVRQYNIILGFPSRPDLGYAMCIMARSAHKVGRKFSAATKQIPTDSFRQVFELTPFGDQNDAGERFYNYKYKRKGFIKDGHKLFEEYELAYESFKAMETFNVKDADKDPDPEAGAAPLDDAVPDSGAKY